MSSDYTGSKYREKECCPLQQQHRTDRKSSLAARVGLGDLPSNQFNYTSNTHTKIPDYKMSRQASIDLNKSMGKSESSKGGGSRWLDN